MKIDIVHEEANANLMNRTVNAVHVEKTMA